GLGDVFEPTAQGFLQATLLFFRVGFFVFPFQSLDPIMSKKRTPPLPHSDNKVERHMPLIDLPLTYYKGIGKVIQAHALLEAAVSELIFSLMRTRAPEGRVAFEYRAASTMFTVARRLLELHG